jgi:pimeloyl-ACP methyl ester carboxylesterase
MSMRACVACLALALLTSACNQYGRFINNDDQTFTTLSPTSVVVLYSPDASGELAPELCPDIYPSPIGLVPQRYLLPPVIQALADTGGDLLVYADCSLARGQRNAAAFELVRPKPCFARGAEATTGYVELKACRRYTDLQRLVEEVKRNLPRDRIFVAGSGVGGWAALLAARDPFRVFNAAIVIDPAITGPDVPRNDTWDGAAKRHLDWLASGASIPALVMADPGATPESDALKNLTATAPDFHIVPTADPAAEAQAIRAYIDCRLQNPTNPCSGTAGTS